MANKQKNPGLLPIQAFRLIQMTPHLYQMVVKGNPAELAKLSDRGFRYRAQRNAPDKTPCLWCGATKQPNGRPLEVAHINGHEEDFAPENLAWTCRPCNVRVAHVMKAAGLGRPTNQFNPGAGADASVGKWANAVLLMRGDVVGTPAAVRKAVHTVRNTPPEARAEMVAHMWRRRRSNPAQGAQTIAQWSHAVKMMRSFDPDESDAGYELVMATDPDSRSRFNRQLWSFRKKMRSR